MLLAACFSSGMAIVNTKNINIALQLQLNTLEEPVTNLTELVQEKYILSRFA